MGVHRCVSGSSSQVFTITVGDVLSGLRISEPLGKTKVDDVNVMLLFADSDEEVVWLNISVEEVSGMHELDSLELINV